MLKTLINKKVYSPLIDRFTERIYKTDTCWIWCGQIRKDGYGFFWNGSKKVLAHRWSYQYYVGALLDGLELDHLCRNKRCVNPAHLEQVIHKVNSERGLHALKTHCPHGHEYDKKNTYLNPRGGRICKRCRADNEALRRKALTL